jgi:hypothetical protein
MKPNHHYFESLCALAINEELSKAELVELHRHSLACVSCRNRIHEMTRLDACLRLSPAFTRRNGRVPKGMRERFVARAIKEGVPLNAPATIGLNNLSLASALFIILLVTAAAIRTGPFTGPTPDASHSGGAELANPVQVARLTPPSSTVVALSKGRDRSREPRSKMHWTPDPSSGAQARESGALPGHLETFQNRYIPAAFPSPHYLLAMAPDAARPWPSVASKFRLAVPQTLIRDNTLLLLADSEPMFKPSRFTFATPGAQVFRPALEIGPHGTHAIFELGETPLTFHFVNVTQ